MKLRNSLALLALLGVSLQSVTPAVGANDHGHSHDHGDHHGHAHDHGHDDHKEPVAEAVAEKPSHPVFPADLLKRIEFVETFQQGPLALEKGWISSKNERYFQSEWIVASTFLEEDDEKKDERQPAFKDEQSLAVHVKHHHYGLTHVLAEPFDNTGKTMVFQYEVRLHEGIGCSGAYAKLLLKQDGFDPLALEEATPYVVMFGPDRCGSTNKVHFIVRQKQPNGKWEEKHMSKSVPGQTSDSYTHLYTLIIRPDNSFQVLVDNHEQASGSLLSASDFSPPFGAPKEINDPSDAKPADWEEEEKIPDPKATKPYDWDEDAPKSIPDPDAKRPEDWSDEDDGEWMAPDIPNPEFKGKWTTPIITNPAYKGKWKARKIPNPDFFSDEHPSNLAPIGAISFEILANDRGIAFDNILLTHDESAAKEFTALTFEAKRNLERAHEDLARKTREKAARVRGLNEGGPYGVIMYYIGEARDFVNANIIPIAISLALILLPCLYWCCFTSPPNKRVSLTAGAEGREKAEVEDEDEDEDADEDRFSPPVEGAKKEPRVEVVTEIGRAHV